MTDVLQCDVAIIGAGTAGLAAERSARNSGARTLLIDPDFNGTTCANVGCMPSKLLIAAAHAAHAARTASVFGIHAEPIVDGPAVLQRLRKERDRFAKATRRGIAKLPPEVRIRARAKFSGPRTLILSDGRRIEARAIVVATGSRPSIPKNFKAIEHLVLTNETVFELDTLPTDLAVVGAGPLGLELAQAMARLGVRVTLLDRLKSLGTKCDEGLADRMKDVFAREMNIALGVEIEAQTRHGKAHLRWTGEMNGEGEFERVLVAAGRPPRLEELAIERSGVDLDEDMVPIFDRETMQCGESNIYLAGDVDADRPVLHEASAEGAIAGANAARHPEARKGHRCVPLSIMFTDPPFVQAGRVAGDHLVMGSADYSDQGRARVENQAEGVAQLYAEPGDGRLVGALLFCPGADHLGHLLAWAIESGASTKDLLDRPFYHPTFEEGLKPALRMICKQVGLPAPATRDEGAPAGA